MTDHGKPLELTFDVEESNQRWADYVATLPEGTARRTVTYSPFQAITLMVPRGWKVAQDGDGITITRTLHPSELGGRFGQRVRQTIRRAKRQRATRARQVANMVRRTRR